MFAKAFKLDKIYKTWKSVNQGLRGIYPLKKLEYLSYVMKLLLKCLCMD